MVSERMKRLINGSSVIRAMFEEGNRLKQIYGEDQVFDFSLGNPNSPAPLPFDQAVIRLSSEKNKMNLHGYMDNRGHSSVRKKIVEQLNKKFHTSFHENNLLMTVGAAGGLNVFLGSLLNPEDEVLTFSPFFPEYKHYTENFGGKLIALPPNEKDGFRPNLQALETTITPKTKVVIINNPNNPTGVVYTEEEIRAVAEILTKKAKKFGSPIYLLSDEPYRELVYDGKKAPFIPHFYSDTVVCYSFSKSLSLAGERIGYLLISDEVKEGEELLQAAKIATRIFGFVNAPSLIQLAVSECLSLSPDFSIYDKNRKLLFSSLVKMGFTLIKPEGAFYLFMKTPVEDHLFVEKAKEFRLLFVPASAFGTPGYVRIAYCVKPETVKNALPAFQKLAKYYGLVPTE